MSEEPLGCLAVIPSTVAVGERWALKMKVLGPVIEVPPGGQFNHRKPGLVSPFNVNPTRHIRFHDNVLPAWQGRWRVDGGEALEGPAEVVFDGENQGSFPGDKRPIGVFGGFRWTRPGCHFLRLIEAESGLECWANPVWVSATAPAERIFWGDPHWQTFFSDGIRCPEELYHFARAEGFLDFGAISDHMEAITPRQWDYFQAVTNDYNRPGEFATLVGQEWTHHDPAFGAPGHRNIYVRGDRAPLLASTDPTCNTLAKLWQRLDAIDQPVMAIPHHPANAVMGVDWRQGWNSRYEKAVEIYSVWGSSERPQDAGNPRPIHPQNLGGEKAGQHVVDALALGYRLGFTGGGDIHDGRPGDELHNESYPPKPSRSHPEGFCAVFAPELSREAVFDAIAGRRSYASTKRRLLLRVTPRPGDWRVEAAAEDGIAAAVVVRNGEEAARLQPGSDARVLDERLDLRLEAGEYAYLRLETTDGHLAWASPVYGEA